MQLDHGHGSRVVRSFVRPSEGAFSAREGGRDWGMENRRCNSKGRKKGIREGEKAGDLGVSGVASVKGKSLSWKS